MTELNTTRECINHLHNRMSATYFPPLGETTCKSIRAVLDELARVREELESARRVITDLKGFLHVDHATNYETVMESLKQYDVRFGGRE